MPPNAHKASYTIACTSSFRDDVNALATTLRANVADIARSVLLTIPEEIIRSIPDPGGPPPGDREPILIKTGPSAGKLWQRKPRLQVRLPAGYRVSTVRRALNVALKLNHATLVLNLTDSSPLLGENPPIPSPQDELERMKKIISLLVFTPLEGGVVSEECALHVLGFAPNDSPDKPSVRARFRALAPIHHPDSPFGSHQRMSQLNAAMQLLCK